MTPAQNSKAFNSVEMEAQYLFHRSHIGNRCHNIDIIPALQDVVSSRM